MKRLLTIPFTIAIKLLLAASAILFAGAAFCSVPRDLLQGHSFQEIEKKWLWVEENLKQLKVELEAIQKAIDQARENQFITQLAGLEEE